VVSRRSRDKQTLGTRIISLEAKTAKNKRNSSGEFVEESDSTRQTVFTEDLGNIERLAATEKLTVDAPGGVRINNLTLNVNSDVGVGFGKEHAQGSIDAAGQMFQNDGLAVVDVGDVATASARGVVELATNTEANAATDTSKAVTPSGLAVLKSDVANALARTTNIAVVQVDTTIRTAGTSWTLGPTFSTISGFKANSWVKLFYHVPSRNQSGSWGGIYIEPQVSWNGAAYQSLGGTGFENMVLNGEEILTFNNTLLLDPGFASVFSARFRFYFRSYDGTTGWGNSNRNINTVSGTVSMMTGNNGNQHYPHIVVEEITR
jgi:hypothetical protein